MAMTLDEIEVAFYEEIRSQRKSSPSKSWDIDVMMSLRKFCDGPMIIGSAAGMIWLGVDMDRFAAEATRDVIASLATNCAIYDPRYKKLAIVIPTWRKML